MQSAFDLLNKITKKKRSQAELLEYLQPINPKLHDKLKGCASYLLIREWIESGETRLRNANFCKRFQLCPACAVRRGAKLAENALPKITHLMAENSDLTPVMITLTVPNTKNLSDGLERLKMAFSAMMASRRKCLSNPDRNTPIEFCKVQGGIRSMEATHKGKGWHPHLHIFALISDWIDRVELSKEFQRFGGGKIVDVRKVKEGENGLVSGLLEVLKYPTKFSDLTPEKRYEFWLGANSTRLTDCFGNMRGLKIGDIDQDDLNLEGAYRDWVARWYHSRQGYRLWKANAWDDANEEQEEPVPEP